MRAVFNAPVIKLFEVCFLLTQTKYVGALFPAPETGESPETDLSVRTRCKVTVINRKLQDFYFYRFDFVPRERAISAQKMIDTLQLSTAANETTTSKIRHLRLSEGRLLNISINFHNSGSRQTFDANCMDRAHNLSDKRLN